MWWSPPQASGSRRISKSQTGLYRCHEEARQGGNVAEAFAPVASRFQEIAAQLGLSLDLEEEFRATLWAMERGAGQDFCASRGEYFSARIMAALLNLPFLDPAQCIFFDEKGQFDGEAAQKTLAASSRICLGR